MRLIVGRRITDFFNTLTRLFTYGLALFDPDDQGQEATVWVSGDNNTSWGTENDALAAADTIGDDYTCVIDIAASDWQDGGGWRTAFVQPSGCLLKAGASSTSWYVVIESEGTGTYASGYWVAHFIIMQD